MWNGLFREFLESFLEFNLIYTILIDLQSIQKSLLVLILVYLKFINDIFDVNFIYIKEEK